MREEFLIQNSKPLGFFSCATGLFWSINYSSIHLDEFTQWDAFNDPYGLLNASLFFGDAIMSNSPLHEAVKLFNRLPAGNPEKEKLAIEIEVAIKQKLGKIALKVV